MLISLVKIVLRNLGKIVRPRVWLVGTWILARSVARILCTIVSLIRTKVGIYVRILSTKVTLVVLLVGVCHI